MPEIPDHIDVVRRLHEAHPPAKTLDAAFNFARRVAWELRAEGCGLLQKGPGGENEIEYQGTWYSAGRVCYPDGQIAKVLTDVPTTNGPTWGDHDTVDPARYRPALPPDDVSPPLPPPPPPPDPIAEEVRRLRDELGNLKTTVTVLDHNLDLVKARVETLEQAPVPTPTLPELETTETGRWYARHKHGVVRKT